MWTRHSKTTSFQTYHWLLIIIEAFLLVETDMNFSEPDGADCKTAMVNERKWSSFRQQFVAIITSLIILLVEVDFRSSLLGETFAVVKFCIIYQKPELSCYVELSRIIRPNSILDKVLGFMFTKTFILKIVYKFITLPFMSMRYFLTWCFSKNY